MIENNISNPGTVSRILWHFTGGPAWNKELKKQDGILKPSKNAYRNLINILKIKTLNLGDYSEILTIILPKLTAYDKEQKKRIEKKNVKITLESCPVCCLADIPIIHLEYHATGYGKFALGFHRDSIIRHGFNPVLYTLHNTEIIRQIYTGLSKLELIDPESIEDIASSITFSVDDIKDKDVSDDIEYYAWDLESEADTIKGYRNEALQSLNSFIAFVKTFDVSEFGSIYCEREWRSTKPFKFSYRDIAMIVIPRNVGHDEYFDDFCNNIIPELDLPRSIPVVPWEDLIE